MIHCSECDASLGPKIIDNIRWGLWECNTDGTPAAAFIEYDLRDKPEAEMHMLVLPVEMAKWLVGRWNDAVAARMTS